MKKSIKVLLIISVLSILLCLFFFQFISWQKVSISGIGIFKVPKDWIVTKKENVIYITDRSIEEKEYKIYLIGINKVKDDDGKYHYEFFEDIERIGNHESVVYSNSASYWIELFCINENIEEKYVISFSNVSGDRSFLNSSIYFLAWDNLIDEETIVKIVKTFTTHPL